MPSTLRPPKYCRQKQKGRPDRAYVKVHGKRIMLGAYGSPESYEKYTKAISHQEPAPETAKPAPASPTVAMLMVDYLDFAVGRYGGDKASEVVHIKGAFRILRRTHGEALGRDFGPKAFQAMRRAMIDAGWSRNYIGDQCQRVKRFIAWGVSEELLPRDARHALDAVSPLRKSEFGARETAPVRLVDAATIEATLPHLSDTVADMVRLMQLTGMRPGELVQLAADRIDRSGEAWIFTPPKHKTEHHGKRREVAIGPLAQKVLAKYLFGDRCFNYSSASFRRALHRGCDRAFPHPELSKFKKLTKSQQQELKDWRSANRWSPNRLRHSAATNIRETLGLEYAQVALGHSRADVTQIYAETNRERAIEVALKMG